MGHSQALSVLMNYIMNLDMQDDRGELFIFFFYIIHFRTHFCKVIRNNLIVARVLRFFAKGSIERGLTRNFIPSQF